MAVGVDIDVEVLRCEIKKNLRQGVPGTRRGLHLTLPAVIGLKRADDQELTRLARQPVEEHHPEMERSDEQLRARVGR